MSSNHYPEPPKLSSAKELMKMMHSEKTTEFIVPETETPPTQQEISEHIETNENSNVEAVEDHSIVPVEHAPEQPSMNEDEISGDESDVESNDLLVEPTEGLKEEILSEQSEEDVEDISEEESKEPVKETYSAWGIIKHTGFVPVSLWAVLTGGATGAAAFFFAPGQYTWIALGVLGFMTGMIAAVDRKTHLIKNQHTILTAILSVPLALLVAFNLGAWNFLFGILAALLVFGVFLYLVIKVNFGSGGDIKFSPVPAFALGVINPLISALWLFYALIFTFIILVVRKQKRTSFGEGMAISLPLAIFSVFALYAATGMPYLHATL